MRKAPAMLAALTVLAALSCRRPLRLLGGKDAGDTGLPANVDAAPAGDSTFEAPADAPAEVPADVPADVTADVTGDAAPDVVAAVCPAGVAPLDVCGCGCCAGPPPPRACYYPSRGESREGIPNPTPSPASCRLNGCDEGVRHVCCADPGPQAAHGTVCAIDTSIEDLPRFTVTERDGATCTTLEVGGAASLLPISVPPGFLGSSGWRGPCDGSTPAVFAIGGLGQVTPGRSGTLLPFPRYDVHVALFFDALDALGGVADVVRIDRDDVGVAPRCTGTCPTCGTVCSLDTSYRYGYTGGLVRFHDTVILTPPASFTHVRSPVTTMPADLSCAPPFPACGAAAIDVGDVMAVLLDPDVQEALLSSQGAGTIPFYGVDPRPSDGQAFQIARDGGGGFMVGGPCPAGASPSSCLPIPAGLGRLVSVLTALDPQQLADPSCVAIRP